MTREMGVRFAAEGVRISAVAPGLVYSPLTENVVGDLEANAEMRRLHPMGRIGGTEEIAAVAAFLASDDAANVTASIGPVYVGYKSQQIWLVQNSYRTGNSKFQLDDSLEGLARGLQIGHFMAC